MDTLPVLASVERVVDRSEWVVFHPGRVGTAVEQWGKLLESKSTWLHPCHYFDGGENSVRWIFVLDLLNHCFWPDATEATWTVSYGGELYSGYWGLAASLKRALEQGIPIADAGYLAKISADDLSRVFSGQGIIPLFEERLANLHEAGVCLQSHWRGDVINLVAAAQGSAVQLVELVTRSVPSFRDEASYRGETVYFWKRAQIFAADLYQAFSGRDWGLFRDVELLTAFADYKLPQVLRQLGIISYQPELADKIDRLVLLEPGCPEEVEIRAATIWAVEAMRDCFKEGGRDLTGIQVDNWLWQLGQLDRFRKKPYHRCRTMFY